MKALRVFDRALTAVVNTLLLLSFSIMLGLAALQVLLRFFFHSGILWGDVAARNLVIWVGFFGAYLATRENRHFRIDVLTRLVPLRIRSWLFAFTDLFAAVICYFLFQASQNFVKLGIDPDSIAFLQVPQSVVAMIVPVGFGLIIVQFLIRTVESVVAAVRGTPAEGDA
jgi:TRAP-type C4-dicarboxylate transport system permease small subunit